MKHQNLVRTILMIVSLSLLGAGSAWGNAEPTAEEPTKAAQEDVIEAVDEAVAEAGVEDVVADIPAEPTGLDVVMDGTSMDTWNESMEEVREIGGDGEYGQVSKAFDYLLMFDIGAKGDPAILASRLNGMTGNEILQRVKYRKGK